MGDHTYDVIVIRAGPVGEDVADRVVQGGIGVADVERVLPGGERSYRACRPAEALLRSTAALRAVDERGELVPESAV
jgi:pyruvate/2-oxoglutarate dehydrogenase complex dihydrolipoamide dehydrogenase (E3) component